MMIRALAVVLIFDFMSAVPRIGMPLLMPRPAPEIVDAQMPTNNRFGRRRAAKFARAA
jgi:hypothetical protein